MIVHQVSPAAQHPSAHRVVASPEVSEVQYGSFRRGWQFSLLHNEEGYAQHEKADETRGAESPCYSASGRVDDLGESDGKYETSYGGPGAEDPVDHRSPPPVVARDGG